MDPKIILVKTQKGIDEIKTRANRLPQHRRNVLIFIDGRFSVGELVTRFANVGELAGTLQGLVDDGYAAPVGTAGGGGAAAPAQPRAAPPAPPAAAGSPAAPPAAGVGPTATAPSVATPSAPPSNVAVPGHQLAEFRQEVRTLSRTLYDAIGPDADAVTAKLEQAIDRESFLDAVQRCGRMVEGLAGARKAAAFRERAQAIVARFLGG